MEKTMLQVESLAWVVKSLLAAYIITTLSLLMLAFGLYKFDLTEQTIQGGIIAIYVLSAFIGGRVAGKLRKTRRFIWGFASGLCYFLMLMLISFLVYHSVQTGMESVLNLLLCALGGMLGGMTS